MSDCCLQLDAMSIRKQVIFDQNKSKFTRFVNYGGTIPEDSETLASEVLVFLLNGLKVN